MSYSSLILSIALACDDYLEAVNPLRARSRNAGDAVATRGNQGVSGMISMGRLSAHERTTHPEPPLALPKMPDLLPELVTSSSPSIHKPART